MAIVRRQSRLSVSLAVAVLVGVVIGRLWEPQQVAAQRDGDRTSLEQLVDRIEALEDKLGDVQIDAAGDVIFEGVNVHIRNGQGATETTNGKGNLIVGYNEESTWIENSRTGSHNIVVGTGHTFTRFGGIVAGDDNSITGDFASITGGSGNVASGELSSVSGGRRNEATDYHASVSGGLANEATANYSSVSGGSLNIASGGASSISGGTENWADAPLASVSGGKWNIANGENSTVGGGFDRTASGAYDWRAGGLFEDR
jgi:hypothetical protein